MEFYYSPDGLKILYSNNGQFGELTQNNEELIDHIIELIESNYPKAYKRLLDKYNINVKGNKSFYFIRIEKFKMVHRFVRCNLSLTDNVPDVTDNGRLNIENVYCPLKGSGECSDENCICNPELSTALSARELEIVNLICDCLTDQEIADRLYISKFTAENHRKNILHKLNLKSKEEIIVWAFNHGIRKRNE